MFHCRGGEFPCPVQAVGTRSPRLTVVFVLQGKVWGLLFSVPVEAQLPALCFNLISAVEKLRGTAVG